MTGPVKVPFPVEGCIPLPELCRLFQVSPGTVRRRLRAEGRTAFTHPGDRRLRLVREEDVRAIFELRSAPRRGHDDTRSQR